MVELDPREIDRSADDFSKKNYPNQFIDHIVQFTSFNLFGGREFMISIVWNDEIVRYYVTTRDLFLKNSFLPVWKFDVPMTFHWLAFLSKSTLINK